MTQQNFQKLLKNGQDNLANKHYDAAIANLTAALKLNPSDAPTQTALKEAEKARGAAVTDPKALTEAKLRTESHPVFSSSAIARSITPASRTGTFP